MKVILSTPNFSLEKISELRFDPETRTLTFKHGNKTHSTTVEESLGSVVKIYDDDSIEIINYEASV